MILPADFDPDAPWEQMVKQLATVYPRDVAEALATYVIDGPADGFDLE